MKTGIQSRLLLITTLVLGTFLTLTGYVLDRSFRASIVAGAEEQMRLIVFSLMGSAQEHKDHLDFGGELTEPRLNQPESGLYASVVTGFGDVAWQSPSSVTTDLDFPADLRHLEPGEFRFWEAEHAGILRFYLSYAVIWESVQDRLLVFTVVADQAPYLSAIKGFRRNLYVGLGAVTILFVFAQFLAVRWGLRPLRTMAEEVHQMERGERERLSAAYPKELAGLANNLDRFVAHEKRNRSRYRKAMEDLAHSLKTPLAVIRNGLSQLGRGEDADRAAGQNGVAQAPDTRRLLAEQLDRMETTVSHQLSRASLTGPVVVGRAINVHAVVDRLLRALRTAFSERNFTWEVHIPKDLCIRGDERDVLEILGNLLENAFKYGKSKVHISASQNVRTSIVVEDDGPGVAPEMRRQVLQRGTRADQVQKGQGIGLSVVAELMALYNGDIEIDTSPLGGASIQLHFPR